MYKEFKGQADFRLAQLTEATGLSPELIRAWERRYGFPSPARTRGGHRRYTEEEVELVHRAAMLVRSGFRAREAIARAVQIAAADQAGGDARDISAESLAGELVAGDPGRALALLLGSERVLGFERALEERVLPALREVGAEWVSGRLSIAQEHTATGLVISWLGTVRSGLAPVAGPITVLIATPAGEHHAVAVWALELLLRRRGVAALALGSDVPHEALVSEMATRKPVALVLALTGSEARPAVRRVAAAARAALIQIFIGGPGVRGPIGGAERLPSSLTAAAERLAEVLAAR